MRTASLIKEEPNKVFSVLPAVYWHLYSINTYLELSVELLISLGLGQSSFLVPIPLNLISVNRDH